jgi:hypothetical protein
VSDRNYWMESELRREENVKLCKRIDGYEAEVAALRAKLRDRERRIRLARKLADRNIYLLAEEKQQVFDALNLRRPVKGRKR